MEETQTQKEIENPNKIVDYAVVSSQSLTGFQTEVKKAIDRGWEPQGGIAVSVIGNSKSYTQAFVARLGVVKEIEEKREEQSKKSKGKGFFNQMFSKE